MSFVSHFERLLGTKVDCRPLDSNITAGSVLSELQQQNLTAPVTLEEIRTTLFDIGSD